MLFGKCCRGVFGGDDGTQFVHRDIGEIAVAVDYHLRQHPITSSQMPNIAYLIVQQNISPRCRAYMSRSLGFQALPTSFGVVRSAPKRSLADSSDESVPTEIHRSFRREPVVVHARRSPSNGRRGAAGSWLVSEPAGQVGGRARRHSLWTSQPSTTSTNAMIPVG